MRPRTPPGSARYVNSDSDSLACGSALAGLRSLLFDVLPLAAPKHGVPCHTSLHGRCVQAPFCARHGALTAQLRLTAAGAALEPWRVYDLDERLAPQGDVLVLQLLGRTAYTPLSASAKAVTYELGPGDELFLPGKMVRSTNVLSLEPSVHLSLSAVYAFDAMSDDAE